MITIQVWIINILVMQSRGRTEKAKMDKSTIGRKPQMIRIKADKTPKNEKIFKNSNNQGVRSHDHLIQVCTINIHVMRSRGRTEKRKNGQKHHRTKRTKGSESKRTKPQRMRKYFNTPNGRTEKESRRTKPTKMRKYFNTPTIKAHRYKCGQSTFSSCDHVDGQRKAKMDKSTIGRKNLKVPESKQTKPPKMRKYFNSPTIKVYDPMITWHKCGQSTFSSCDHVDGQRKAKMDKSTIGRKNQRIRIKADKTPKNEKIF